MSSDSLISLSANTRSFWVGSGGAVDVRDRESLSALIFLRDFVATSRPLLINRLTPTSLRSLDDVAASIAADGGATIVSVNVTPDGLADSIVRNTDVFAEPEQRSMPFAEFVHELRRRRVKHDDDASDDGGVCSSGGDGASTVRSTTTAAAAATAGSGSVAGTRTGSAGTAEARSVFYLSHQNDNLREQLPCLGSVNASGRSVIDSDFPFATEAFGALPDAMNLWIGDENSISSIHADPYENMFVD